MLIRSLRGEQESVEVLLFLRRLSMHECSHAGIQITMSFLRDGRDACRVMSSLPKGVDYHRPGDKNQLKAQDVTG